MDSPTSPQDRHNSSLQSAHSLPSPGSQQYYHRGLGAAALSVSVAAKLRKRQQQQHSYRAALDAAVAAKRATPPLQGPNQHQHSSGHRPRAQPVLHPPRLHPGVAQVSPAARPTGGGSVGGHQTADEQLGGGVGHAQQHGEPLPAQQRGTDPPPSPSPPPPPPTSASPSPPSALMPQGWRAGGVVTEDGAGWSGGAPAAAPPPSAVSPPAPWGAAASEWSAPSASRRPGEEEWVGTSPRAYSSFRLMDPAERERQVR
jgi:hypothetical protein